MTDINANINANNCCVPYKYSKYGLYSSHLFLANGIINYFFGFRVLTGFALSLYLSSVLHWRNVKHNGFYKNLDVVTSFTTISYVTFVDSHYFIASARKMWLLAVTQAVGAYSLNKFIEYKQLEIQPQLENENDICSFAKDDPYSYFSFKWTPPDSVQRDRAYYASVFVHILFIHIPLVFTCVYGVVNSPKLC